MRTASIRIRLLIIAAVVGVSVWIVFPPSETIGLGLDLRGGLQLILRVRTEEALRQQTRAAAEQLEEQLTRTGLSGATVAVVNPSELVVSGIAAESTVVRGLQPPHGKTNDDCF